MIVLYHIPLRLMRMKAYVPPMNWNAWKFLTKITLIEILTKLDSAQKCQLRQSRTSMVHFCFQTRTSDKFTNLNHQAQLPCGWYFQNLCHNHIWKLSLTLWYLSHKQYRLYPLRLTRELPFSQNFNIKTTYNGSQNYKSESSTLICIFSHQITLAHLQSHPSLLHFSLLYQQQAQVLALSFSSHVPASSLSVSSNIQALTTTENYSHLSRAPNHQFPTLRWKNPHFTTPSNNWHEKFQNFYLFHHFLNALIT